MFVVINPDSYVDKSKKPEQISAARRAAANFRHARNRLRSSTALTDHEHESLPPNQKKCPSTNSSTGAVESINSTSRPPLEGSDVEFIEDDANEEGLSLEDLSDLFPNVKLAEERSSNDVHENPHGYHQPIRKLRPWTKATVSQSAHGEAFAQSHPHSMGLAIAAGNIAEINSTLDPFIRLPFEVTDQERGSLHFCELFAASQKSSKMTRKIRPPSQPKMVVGNISES